MSHKINIELSSKTTRLEFSGMGRPLVINPRECKGDSRGVFWPMCSCEGCCREGSEISAVPLSRFIDESGDYEGRFFAFWDEDCMDPPLYVVRAESFEQAYEDFCNEVVEPLDDATLADYERNADGDYDDLTLNEKGWISTESVNGREIDLVSATVHS